MESPIYHIESKHTRAFTRTLNRRSRFVQVVALSVVVVGAKLMQIIFMYLSYEEHLDVIFDSVDLGIIESRLWSKLISWRTWYGSDRFFPNVLPFVQYGIFRVDDRMIPTLRARFRCRSFAISQNGARA